MTDAIIASASLGPFAIQQIEGMASCQVIDDLGINDLHMNIALGDAGRIQTPSCQGIEPQASLAQREARSHVFPVYAARSPALNLSLVEHVAPVVSGIAGFVFVDKAHMDDAALARRLAWILVFDANAFLDQVQAHERDAPAQEKAAPRVDWHALSPLSEASIDSAHKLALMAVS